MVTPNQSGWEEPGIGWMPAFVEQAAPDPSECDDECPIVVTDDAPLPNRSADEPQAAAVVADKPEAAAVVADKPEAPAVVADKPEAAAVVAEKPDRKDIPPHPLDLMFAWSDRAERVRWMLRDFLNRRVPSPCRPDTAPWQRESSVQQLLEARALSTVRPLGMQAKDLEPLCRDIEQRLPRFEPQFAWVHASPTEEQPKSQASNLGGGKQDLRLRISVSAGWRDQGCPPLECVIIVSDIGLDVEGI